MSDQSYPNNPKPKDQERVSSPPDINREAKGDKELIHPAFPSQGTVRPSYMGSQSNIPDK